MESLGQKLREAREGHNFSVEQVARDTHISKQYLEALEAEEFSLIPGETYVIGFLRNYAEYLSLDPEELVTLYRNMQIQEQPLPMTELLERRRSGPPARILLLIIAVVAVLGGGGYLLYRLVRGSSPPSSPEAAAPKAGRSGAAETAGREVEFREEALTRWFNLEDSIAVPLNGDTYRLRLIQVGDTLTVKVPGGTLEMTIGQERQVDLNGDGRNDLRILLNDLDATQLAKRANLSLYKIIKGSSAQPAAAEGAQETAQGAPPPAAGEQAAARVSPAGTAAPSAAGVITVSEAPSPAPFRVGISFRGYCLFRYLVDGKIREERFFHKGESFSLDAKNAMVLWISNAGAVRLAIAGRELDAGRPGAVTVKEIRWNRDEQTGQYALQVLPRE